jgi:DNA modification methylase
MAKGGINMKVIDQCISKNYALYNGDCVEVMKEIPDNSIHGMGFSPPFSSLYTYSASERDMGNARSDEEFIQNFKFAGDEMYRIIMPGRLMWIHCMDIPRLKERDGFIGLQDFPGELIRLFEDIGFIYHSRVMIWKDPLTEATRTKSLGLMHKQIVKDSSMCRQGLPDYLIVMRKPGENPERIKHPNGFENFIGENEPQAPHKAAKLHSKDSETADHKSSILSSDPIYSHQVWRRYASPVWMDINQSDTLNREAARENGDEKHICPLQLDVIARALELWTNPGDTVLSPFAGIGSEIYQAIKMGRKGVGIELKSSYYKQAVLNCKQAECECEQPTLFDYVEKQRE